MDPWWAAALFVMLAGVLSFGMLAAARMLRVRPALPPPPTRTATYECGEEPDGIAWVRFHPRYYVVALLFILFGVEVAFLLPWALNLREHGPLALADMGIFLFVLLLGWFYALRKGALRWQ